MNKFALTLLAVLAIVTAVEAAPHHRRREPPRRPHAHHHHRPKKGPSWGWGLNFSPGGLSLGVGTRVGRHGVIGVNIPLIKPEPVIREKTVIVQQPVVQQPIVVQQPVVQQPVVIQQPVIQQPIIQQPVQQQVIYSVNDTLTPTRVWVEGHWKIVRDAYGNTISKNWIPGHWE